MTTSMNLIHGLLILIISSGCLKPSSSEQVVPPKIDHGSLKDVTFSNNLSCHASGSDNKTYGWRLPDNSLRSTGINSSYRPEMCGPHQCLVTNKAGTDISNVFNVTACDSAHTVQETTLSRDQDGYLVLPCTMPRDHPLSRFKKLWKKPQFQSGKNVNQTDDDTLILLRLDTLDAGLYVCEAFDVSEHKKIDIVRYQVEVSPKRNSGDIKRLELVYSSNDIITTEDTKVSLVCIFSETNFSKPNSVFWVMESMNKTKVSFYGNETITIDRVKLEDAGNITCSFRGLSHYISLRVRALPKCSESFQNQNVTSGQDVTFVCLKPLNLQPYNHLQWFINGSYLKEHDGLTEVNFMNVTSSFVITVNISNGLQNQFYSVYAMVYDTTTSVKTTTTTTTISITNLPTTPTTFTTFSTTSTKPTIPTILTKPTISITSIITTSTTKTSITTQPIPKIFKTSTTSPSTVSTTTANPSSLSDSLVYIIVGIVVGVLLILIIPATICIVKRKLKSKRKHQQNSITPSSQPLVLANMAMNHPPPPPPPANIDQLVNQQHHHHQVIIIPDEDSMSLRSSDSGFSDPTNEPLLKSDEQLNNANNENKSKSDSEPALADHNDRSMMMSSVC